jgi:hypothetical protein
MVSVYPYDFNVVGLSTDERHEFPLVFRKAFEVQIIEYVTIQNEAFVGSPLSYKKVSKVGGVRPY